MEPLQLSLRADGGAAYADQRAAYLAQLVAPLDDMWMSFADAATAHALCVGDDVVGSCCVDDEGQLLRFYVEPRFRPHAEALLRLALEQLEVARIVVCTLDPDGLSTALDLASSVTSHTLLYAPVFDPEPRGVAEPVLAEVEQHGRIVAFQAEETGAPRAFLETYVRERLERQEILLFESDAGLLCVGEVRADRYQAGISHVGLIVRGEERGRGIGTGVLARLVRRSRELGLAPHCSTEVTNLAARHAIERAGFRASHRLLQVGFEL